MGDRFGRRTYHFRPKRSSRQSQPHFFSDDVRHSLFADADINGLDDFLKEDLTPFMTPAISNRIKRPSIIPRPSFQCFASINHEQFHGLDYDDNDSMDSADMQYSKEWNMTHLNTMSNKLNAVKEYLEL